MAKKNNKKNNVRKNTTKFSKKYLNTLTFDINNNYTKELINIPLGVNTEIIDIVNTYDATISWDNYDVCLRLYNINCQKLSEIAGNHKICKLAFFICRSIDTYNQMNDRLINSLTISCPDRSMIMAIPVERDATLSRVQELMTAMAAYYSREFCTYTMQDIAKILLKRRTKIYQDHAFNKDDFQKILKEINLVLTNDSYYRKTVYETINKYTAAIMGCSIADAIKDDDELKTYIANDVIEIIIDKPVQLILKPQNLGNYADAMTHTFNYIKRKISEYLATDITEE